VVKNAELSSGSDASPLFQLTDPSGEEKKANRDPEIWVPMSACHVLRPLAEELDQIGRASSPIGAPPPGGWRPGATFTGGTPGLMERAEYSDTDRHGTALTGAVRRAGRTVGAEMGPEHFHGWRTFYHMSDAYWKTAGVAGVLCAGAVGLVALFVVACVLGAAIRHPPF